MRNLDKMKGTWGWKAITATRVDGCQPIEGSHAGGGRTHDARPDPLA
ncbi:hypothetical protein [Cereibacter johrii]